MRRAVVAVVLVAFSVGASAPVVVGSQPSPPSPLAFDETQAVASNGTLIDADMTRVCGADDRRFLGELLDGNPLDFQIPYRLGDIVEGNAEPTAVDGKQMMVSGVVDSDVFGTGDFPFDHPGGSDFNMDVLPDAPYADLAQVGGVPSGGSLHIELSEFMVPHLPSAPTGPPTGMTWEDNSQMSREEIQPGYFPSKGDRVIVQGRWIDDCGHLPFSTELHPLTFLAWSHTEGKRTVAQSYYAPYREMQLYSATRANANQVNDDSRAGLADTMSFPEGLVQTILRIQDLGPLPPLDHVESWGLLEATGESPADWWVCAPEGTSGDVLVVNYDFRARPGVEITATPDTASGCARMHTDLGTSTIPEPDLRTCTLPWDWLSQVAADEAGVPSLDLQEIIKGFVADAYDYRLDPDPIMDCYDPLASEPVSPSPQTQNVTYDPTLHHPFYGRVEVSWATAPPTSSSTTSSSSTTTSSSSTTPEGQSLTVTPRVVAAGAVIEVTSGGWLPNTPVTFLLDDGTVLGTIQTDRFGVASGSFTIPEDTLPGEHQVIAQGTSVDGDAEVSVAIRVDGVVAVADVTPVSTGGRLPSTGRPIATTIALACALVLAGFGLVAATRARRRDRPS